MGTRAGAPRRSELRTSEDARRLYGDLAWTWPIISPPEDYVRESEFFARTVRRESAFRPRTLLHLGCGGGHNDLTLSRHFDVTGVDTSPSMLRLARRLNPEVEYRLGDMRRVRLRRAFDAVLILDSIGYMLSEADLRAAFATAFVHLRPGGVFLTYVEDEPRRFRQNKTESTVRRRGGVEIVFIENDFDPDPRDTTFESTFVSLIRKGGRLQVGVDRHRSGIFPLRTWERLLKTAGFRVSRRVLPPLGIGAEGIPMFVCRRPGFRLASERR